MSDKAILSIIIAIIIAQFTIILFVYSSVQKIYSILDRESTCEEVINQ